MKGYRVHKRTKKKVNKKFGIAAFCHIWTVYYSRAHIDKSIAKVYGYTYCIKKSISKFEKAVSLSEVRERTITFLGRMHDDLF